MVNPNFFHRKWQLEMTYIAHSKIGAGVRVLDCKWYYLRMKVASYRIIIFLAYFLVSCVVKQLSTAVTLCLHQIPGMFVKGESCRMFSVLWLVSVMFKLRKWHSLILDLGLLCSLLYFRLFFVIEYVNGGDLMFHMQRQRKLPEEHAR